MSYCSLSYGKIPPYRAADRGGLHRAVRQRVKPTDRVPTFEKIIDPDFLLRIFYDLKRNAGQAPGVDRTRYSDLGRSDAPRIMRFISEMLNDECYRHGPTRPVPIPKTGGVRTLQLANIPDRVVSAALNTAMMPYWESVFLPRSFGFRPNLSGWHLMAQLHADIVTTGRSVIVVDDVKKAFNNVPIATTMANHKEYIENPSLLALIEVVLRGSEGVSRLIGLDQGSAYSPTALNVLMHHAHDLWAVSRELFWYRYADNLVYLCRNMPEGREVHEEADAILRKAGLELKREDGPPKDLLTGETAQLLGFTVTMMNGRLRLTPGVEALTKLQDNLERCHECANPPLAAAQVVNGWISYQGPTFGGERERMLETVLETAAHYGFREMNPDSLLEQWEDSWRGWNRLRQKAVASNQPGVSASGVSGLSYRWRPTEADDGEVVRGRSIRGRCPDAARDCARDGRTGAYERAGDPQPVIRPVDMDVGEIEFPTDLEVADPRLHGDEHVREPEPTVCRFAKPNRFGRSRIWYRPGIAECGRRTVLTETLRSRSSRVPRAIHAARPRNRDPPSSRSTRSPHDMMAGQVALRLHYLKEEL